jgi:tetratricopeptide (TPR) repeat protein
MIERTKTIFANVTVIVVIALILIGGTTWWRQRAQFQRGEAAFNARDYLGAIAGYEAAIHLYTPGSRLVERSAQRLWELGGAYERSGDLERALVTYRALRSSFYAAAWLRQPGKDWIDRCDARIAGILRQQGYAGNQIR